MKQEKIDINLIHENPWNANRMSDRTFGALTKSMLSNGFVGSLLVRKDAAGGYELIDGHHRWAALKSLGATEVPVIVLDIDDVESKIISINTADLKGDFDDAELLNILNKMATVLPPDAISDGTGLPIEILEKVILPESNASREELTGHTGTEEENLEEVSLGMSVHDFKVISRYMLESRIPDFSVLIGKVLEE